jgi:hypothetical protein
MSMGDFWALGHFWVLGHFWALGDFDPVFWKGEIPQGHKIYLRFRGIEWASCRIGLI